MSRSFPVHVPDRIRCWCAAYVPLWRAVLVPMFVASCFCCFRLQAQEPARQRGVDELLKVIRSNNKDKRAQALLEMSTLDSIPEKALADVIKIMRTSAETEQVYAAVILGKMGKPAIGQLTPLLEDNDEVVRFYALWSLGLIGQPAKHLVAVVLKAMHDPDDDVRCKAAFALWHIGVPADQAVPILIAALKDTDDLARTSALSALVAYGQAAVPMLIPAITDRQRGPGAVMEVLSASARTPGPRPPSARVGTIGQFGLFFFASSLLRGSQSFLSVTAILFSCADHAIAAETFRKNRSRGKDLDGLVGCQLDLGPTLSSRTALLTIAAR